MIWNTIRWIWVLFEIKPGKPIDSELSLFFGKIILIRKNEFQLLGSLVKVSGYYLLII